MGVNIGTCKYCGKSFRQNKQNNMMYCYKHRGYQKKVLRFGVCIDCGKEFSVSSNNQKKIRCDKCQHEYSINYQRDYQRNLRKNK